MTAYSLFGCPHVQGIPPFRGFLLKCQCTGVIFGCCNNILYWNAWKLQINNRQLRHLGPDLIISSFGFSFIYSYFTFYFLHSICKAWRRNKIRTQQHIWSHLSPSAIVWAQAAWVEGKTTGHGDKLVLCPLPTMRIWYVLSPFYTNPPDICHAHAYTQRQAAAWTCSVTLPYTDSYRGGKGPPRGP